MNGALVGGFASGRFYQFGAKVGSSDSRTPPLPKIAGLTTPTGSWAPIIETAAAVVNEYSYSSPSASSTSREVLPVRADPAVISAQTFGVRHPGALLICNSDTSKDIERSPEKGLPWTLSPV